MSLSCYRDILLCDLASHAASQSTRSGNISTLSCSGTTERSSGGRLLDTTRDISRLHGDIDLQGRNRPSCDASHIRHQLLQRPALSEFLGGDHQTRTSSSIYVPPGLSETYSSMDPPRVLPLYPSLSYPLRTRSQQIVQGSLDLW